MTNIIQHTLIEAGDQRFLTVVVDGQLLPPVDDSHPNFDKILDEVTGLEEEQEGYTGAVFYTEQNFRADFETEINYLKELFDISETVAKRFDKLSERVTVANGQVYFDGDPIDGTIVETILRFLDEGKDDFKPLVNYIEKIASNPEKHSRDQLYDWLKLHETIQITPEGDLIAYKGVSSGGTHPETGEDCYQSGFQGTATVDGITISGYIPNYVGAEVTMPRSQVAHDPATACHTGLHVGTFDYARGYSHGGAMLSVRVNPRDVVSVPTDGGGAKIRVCRYKVEEIIQAPKDGVLVDEYSGDSDGAADVVLEGGPAAVNPQYKQGTPIRYPSLSWAGVLVEDLDPSKGNVKVNWTTGGFSVNTSTAYFDIGSPENQIEFLAEDQLKVGDILVDREGDRAKIVSLNNGGSELQYLDDDCGTGGLYGATTLSALNEANGMFAPWKRG